MKFKITLIFALLFSVQACNEKEDVESLIDQIIGTYSVEENWTYRSDVFGMGSEGSSVNYDSITIERSEVEFYDIFIHDLRDGRRIGAYLSDSLANTFEAPGLNEGDVFFGPGKFSLNGEVIEFDYQFGSLDGVQSDYNVIEGTGIKINL